jgi:hypothetical protein
MNLNVDPWSQAKRRVWRALLAYLLVLVLGGGAGFLVGLFLRWNSSILLFEAILTSVIVLERVLVYGGALFVCVVFGIIGLEGMRARAISRIPLSQLIERARVADLPDR